MTKYSKDEDLRAMFNKFDADGSGYISKDEFITLVSQSKLEIPDPDVLNFFNKIDTNKDGKISLDEFRFYYTYNEGEFKEMVEIFGLYTQLAKYLKNLETIDLTKLQQEVNSSITLKEKTLNSIENLPTSISLFTGNSNDPKVQQVLQTELTAQNCICLKFHVEDVATVQKNLDEYLETLKELLGEFGPQVKEMVDLVKMEVVGCSDGVMIVMNLDSHPIFNTYLGMLKGPLSKINESNVSLSVELGTTLDLEGYKSWKSEDLYNEQGYLCINNKMINPSYLMNMPVCKKMINEMMENNSYAGISSMLTVMSLSKVNLEIILDSDKKKEIIDMFPALNKDENVGEEFSKLIKTNIEESGVADMLEAFSFAGDLIKDLKKANMTAFSFVKKIGDISMVTTVKGNLFNLIKDSEIFDLED